MSQKRTGGGEPEATLELLSPNKQKMLSILGGMKVIKGEDVSELGLGSSVTKNLFPSTSSAEEPYDVEYVTLSPTTEAAEDIIPPDMKVRINLLTCTLIAYSGVGVGWVRRN